TEMARDASEGQIFRPKRISHHAGTTRTCVPVGQPRDRKIRSDATALPATHEPVLWQKQLRFVAEFSIAPALLRCRGIRQSGPNRRRTVPARLPRDASIEPSPADKRAQSGWPSTYCARVSVR